MLVRSDIGAATLSGQLRSHVASYSPVDYVLVTADETFAGSGATDSVRHAKGRIGRTFDDCVPTQLMS